MNCRGGHHRLWAGQWCLGAGCPWGSACSTQGEAVQSLEEANLLISTSEDEQYIGCTWTVISCTRQSALAYDQRVCMSVHHLAHFISSSKQAMRLLLILVL